MAQQKSEDRDKPQGRRKPVVTREPSIRTARVRKRFAASIFVILGVAGIAWLALRGLGPGLDRDSAVTATGPSPKEPELMDPLGGTAPQPERRVASRVEVTDPLASASATAKADVRRLVVEVVDATGRPLEGVKVTGLDVQSEGRFAEAMTDGNGEAQLECEPADLVDATRLCVGAPCLATTPIRVEFAVTEWPTAPVRFVAGPSGSIEITFHMEGSYPLSRHAHAWVRFDDQRCGKESAQGLHETYVGYELTTWSLRIPHVALGQCFRLDSSTPGLAFEDIGFDGPNAAGEVVRVNTTIDHVDCRVVGRLVDRGGNTLGEHRITVDWLADPESKLPAGRWFGQATDREGRFEEFSPTHLTNRASTKLSIRTEAAGEAVRSGTAVWPGAAGAVLLRGFPTIDLGDIVVESEPTIASGRVKDASGNEFGRLAWVRIELRSLDPDLDGGWSPVDALVACDGTFQVGSRYPLRRFELRASAHDRLPSEPVAVESGAQEVELRLRSGGRVEGRLLVAEGVDPGGLDLWIGCVEPAGSSEHRVRGWERFDDGRFLLRSVLPGRYEVIVSYEEVELARLAFASTLDAATLRLEPIDLRQLLHRIALKFVGGDGSVVKAGKVALIHEGEPSSAAIIDREGRANLCALTRVVDVIVSSPGFATLRVEGTTNGATIALEPGLAFRVQVPNLPPAPSGWAYEVELEPQGEGLLAETSDIVRGRLDALGFVTMPAPYAGEFELLVTLQGAGPRESAFVAVLEGVQIEPGTGGSLRTIVVEADAGASRGTIDQTRDR